MIDNGKPMAAVLLGLGVTQAPYISILRELGFLLVGIDRDVNARCVPAMDLHIQEPIDDSHRIRELLNLHEVNPRLVLSEGTDSGALTLGSLNTWFGLSGPKLTSILATRDKAVQRQVASIAGCPQPRIIRSEFDDLELYNTQLIKKPRSGQSSIGVELLSSAASFDLFKKQISDRNVVVEEYLIGHDISVDGIICNGKPTITVFAEKYKHKTNAFVDKALFCRPPTADETRTLNPLLSNLVSHFDVTEGLFHSEWKLVEGNYYLIEVSWRGGGSLLGSDVASAITGKSIPAIHVNVLIGNLPIESFDFAFDISCAMIFPSSQAENDRVLSICNLRALEFEAVTLNDELLEIADCRSRYACIYVKFKQDDESRYRPELLGVLSDIAI